MTRQWGKEEELGENPRGEDGSREGVREAEREEESNGRWSGRVEGLGVRENRGEQKGFGDGERGSSGPGGERLKQKQRTEEDEET